MPVGETNFLTVYNAFDDVIDNATTFRFSCFVSSFVTYLFNEVLEGGRYSVLYFVILESVPYLILTHI